VPFFKQRQPERNANHPALSNAKTEEFFDTLDICDSQDKMVGFILLIETQ
jgi:hypothetical protein